MKNRVLEGIAKAFYQKNMEKFGRKQKNLDVASSWVLW